MPDRLTDLVIPTGDDRLTDLVIPTGDDRLTDLVIPDRRRDHLNHSKDELAWDEMDVSQFTPTKPFVPNPPARGITTGPIWSPDGQRISPAPEVPVDEAHARAAKGFMDRPSIGEKREAEYKAAMAQITGPDKVQLDSQYVTPLSDEFYRDMGKIGMVEQYGREFLGSEAIRKIPFGGKLAMAGGVHVARKRLEDDDYPDNGYGDAMREVDRTVVMREDERQREEQARGKTKLATAVDIAANMPTWGIEYGAAGAFLPKGFWAAPGASLATRAGKWVARGIGRTVLQPQNVAANAIDYRDAGDTWPEAVAKGFASTFIENLSEETGETVVKALGLSHAGRWIGRKIVERWGTLNPTKPLSTLKGILRSGGYDGIVAEVGEEWLGNLMHAVAGTQDFGTGRTGYGIRDIGARAGASLIESRNTTPEMLLGFAIPGLANIAAETPARITRQRQYNQVRDYRKSELHQLAIQEGAERWRKPIEPGQTTDLLNPEPQAPETPPEPQEDLAGVYSGLAGQTQPGATEDVPADLMPQPRREAIPTSIPQMALGGSVSDSRTIPQMASPVDVAAHEAAASPLNDRPEPTGAQKEAGNYKKGHVTVKGMPISVENPQGSTREGTDENGKPWSVTMVNHYGYIRGTRGPDKDHVDVILTPGAETADTAYVIDQINPRTGEFDEPKTVIGPRSEDAAREAYLANYEPGWQGLGAITPMPIDQFKTWVAGKGPQSAVAYRKGTANAEATGGQTAPGSMPERPEGGESGRARVRSVAQDGLAPEEREVAPVEITGEATPRMQRLARLLDKLHAKYQHAVRVRIVATPNGVPAEIRRPDMEAVYDHRDGTVWLVDSNLRSPARGVIVWFHEQIGHHGARGIFESDRAYKNFLRRVYLLAGSKRLRGIARKQGLDLTKLEDQLAVASELLAETAENRAHGQDLSKLHKSVWDKVVAAVHGVLRRVGVRLQATGLEQLEQELAAAISAAESRLRAGKQASGKSSQEVVNPALDDFRAQVKKSGVEYEDGDEFRASPMFVYKRKVGSGAPSVDQWAARAVAMGLATRDEDPYAAVSRLLTGTNRVNQDEGAPEVLTARDLNVGDTFVGARSGDTEIVVERHDDGRIVTVGNRARTYDARAEVALSNQVRQAMTDELAAAQQRRKSLPVVDGTVDAPETEPDTRYDEAPFSVLGDRQQEFDFSDAERSRVKHFARGMLEDLRFYERPTERWQIQQNHARRLAQAVLQDADKPSFKPAEAMQRLREAMVLPEAKAVKQRESGPDLFGSAGVDVPRRGQQEFMFSVLPEFPLVAMHNLSEKNLVFADQMGGLAMPSLGIGRVDAPYGSFGEITLLAPRHLVDPMADRSMRVTDADQYSPRYPDTVYQMGPRARETFREIENWAKETYGSRWSAGMDQEAPDVRSLLDGLESHIEGASSFSRNGVDGLFRDRGLQAYFAGAVMGRVFTGTNQPAVQDRLQAFVDHYRQEFKDWLEKTFGADVHRKMSAGFTRNGNRRFKDYTLENVMAEMRRALRNNEGEGFFYGAGNVRASVAKRYRNLSQIQKDRGRIVDSIDAEKKAMNERMFEIAAQVAGHENDPWWAERFWNAIMDARRSRGGRQAVLKQYGIDSASVPWDDVNQFLDDLRQMPTEYFEAKPQRVVALDEFTAAVIPRNADPEVRQVLGKHQIETVEYDPQQPESRDRAIEELSRKQQIQFSVLDRQHAPTWYSPLQRFLEAKMPKRMPAQDLRRMLDPSKGSGIKQDELDWSGIDEFLAGKATVDKAELLDYLRANQVQVEEVTKGEQSQRAKEINDDLAFLGQERLRIQNVPPQFRTEQDRERLRELAGRSRALSNELSAFHGQERTKYAAYQLPGGKNYRELLLMLPESARLRELDDALQRGENRAEDRAERLALEGRTYRSSHWSEPNVLAHVRFSEHTDADGKRVLFVEEVQSDWHQEGRQRGYAGQIDTTGWTASFDGEYWDVRDAQGSLIYDIHARGAQVNSKSEAISYASKRLSDGGVPRAPWSKTWPEMVMRRMLRWAAEHGFDRLAWTTGEQQADRYDLSKQVDSIRVAKRDNSYVVRAAKDGEIIVNRETTENELPEVVGKELAAKIIAGEGDFEKDSFSGEMVYRGLDLKVGGEGMAAFYDQMIPRYMAKYVKKWGAKVGTTRVDTIPGGPRQMEDILDRQDNPDFRMATVHSVDITPAMRESVLFDGQPMFSVLPARGEASETPPRDADLLSEDDYFESLWKQYEDGSSSRTTPLQRFLDIHIGDWRVSSINGSHGRTIDQLRVLDPSTLSLSEHMVERNEEGRGWDADRYAAWLREGRQPPPIEVVETDDGKLRVTNGHRRVAAAKRAGVPVVAWVSPSMDVPDGWRYDGDPKKPVIKTALTLEAWRDGKAKRTTPLTGGFSDHGNATMQFSVLGSQDELDQLLANAPRDAEGRLLAPNGKPSNLNERQWAQVRTKQFRDWFGDWQAASVNPDTVSTVVDENGEPMVLYHGTRGDFSEFGRTKDIGYHFGTVDQAHHWRFVGIGQTGSIMPVYLRLANPIQLADQIDWNPAALVEELRRVASTGDVVGLTPAIVEEADDARAAAFGANLASDRRKETEFAAIRGVLEKAGFDGFVYGNLSEGDQTERSYVAFRPEQVKSATGNSGAFDATNPDIRFSVASEEDREYLAAVERGDMETAQRMVEAAARRAGFTHRLYHGTPFGGFTVFKERPTYLTESKDVADIYQSSSASSIRTWAVPNDAKPETKELFVRVNNPFDTRKPRHRRMFEEQFFMQGDEDWTGSGTPLTEKGLPDWTDGRDLHDWIVATRKRFDAILLDEGKLPQRDGSLFDRGVSMVVWNPSQIKSADPVTYNDSGAIIPLSQRFNPTSSDIRFSVRDRTVAMDALPDSLGTVFTHTNLITLTGRNGTDRRRLYEAAKYDGDVQAAVDVIAATLKPQRVHDLNRFLDSSRPVYLVPVINEEKNAPNALPIAFAEVLADMIGGQVLYEVTKSTGTPNTNAALHERAQKTIGYRGEITDLTGQYVIVDDAFISGQTVVSLLDYLRQQGADVVAVSTLASGRYGNRLRPDAESFAALHRHTGLTSEELASIIGTDERYLTHAEIRAILLRPRGPSSVRAFAAEEVGNAARRRGQADYRGRTDQNSRSGTSPTNDSGLVSPGDTSPSFSVLPDSDRGGFRFAPAMVRHGADLLLNGTDQRDSWDGQMAQEFGEGIRPYLDHTWRYLHGPDLLKTYERDGRLLRSTAFFARINRVAQDLMIREQKRQLADQLKLEAATAKKVATQVRTEEREVSRAVVKAQRAAAVSAAKKHLETRVGEALADPEPSSIAGAIGKAFEEGLRLGKERGLVRSLDREVDLALRAMAAEEKNGPRFLSALESLHAEIQVIDSMLDGVTDDAEADEIRKRELNRIFGDKRYLRLRRATRGERSATVDALRRAVTAHLGEYYAVHMAALLERTQPAHLYPDYRDIWQAVLDQDQDLADAMQAVQEAKGKAKWLSDQDVSQAEIDKGKARVTKARKHLLDLLKAKSWQDRRAQWIELSRAKALSDREQEEVKAGVRIRRKDAAAAMVDEVTKANPVLRDAAIHAPAHRDPLHRFFSDWRGDQWTRSLNLAGGNEKTVTVGWLLDRLLDGDDAAKTIERDVLVPYDAIRKQLGISDFDLADMISQRRKVELPDKTIEITAAEMMELYCLWNRPHARDTITRNGAKLSRFRGLDGDQYLIPGKDVPTILEGLTPAQVKLANAMQALLTGMGTKGNETSMRLEGREIFTESRYWPQSVDRLDPRAITELEDVQTYRNQQLDRIGITQDVVRHRHPVLVGDVFASFREHVGWMARYTALSEPIVDALKALGDPAVKSAVIARFGRDNLKALHRTMAQLAGFSGQDENYGAFLKTVAFVSRNAAVSILWYRGSSYAANRIGGAELAAAALGNEHPDLVPDYLERAAHPIPLVGANKQVLDVLMQDGYLWDRWEHHFVRTFAQLPVRLREGMTGSQARLAWRKMQTFGLQPMARGEQRSAVALYRTLTEKGAMPSDEAVTLVSRIMRRTQNPSSPLEVAGIHETFKTTGLQALWPFTGQPTVSANFFYAEWLKARHTGNYAAAAAAAVGLVASAITTATTTLFILGISAGGLWEAAPWARSLLYALRRFLTESLDIIHPALSRVFDVADQVLTSGHADLESFFERILNSTSLGIKEILNPRTRNGEFDQAKLERGIIRLVESISMVAGGFAGGPVQAAKLIAGAVGRPLGQSQKPPKQTGVVKSWKPKPVAVPRRQAIATP